jgi:tetratricopeptide (TPR) repeat protein
VRLPLFSDRGAGAAPLLSRVIRRETIRLAVLVAIAIAAVAGTRAIADRSHALERHDAAEWFVRGRARLAQADLAGAVAAFRRAVLKQRGERRYALALADGLARTGDHEAAERVLLALRAASPEDADVNLALARTAAARDDVPTAVRYYQHALYAPWRDLDRRRDVRLQFIRFLLDRGLSAQAVSETIAAAADAPPVAAAEVELGELFARAGDHARAREQFGRALARDGADRAARAGAGRAAFALGDYAAARRHLQGLDDPGAAALATIAGYVVSRDPLATRLAPSERRRRLDANLAHARARLERCVTPAAPAAAAALGSGLAAVTGTRRRVARDDDLLEAAVQLVARVVAAADAHCADDSPIDRALIVIAARHGLDTP